MDTKETANTKDTTDTKEMDHINDICDMNDPNGRVMNINVDFFRKLAAVFGGVLNTYLEASLKEDPDRKTIPVYKYPSTEHKEFACMSYGSPMYELIGGLRGCLIDPSIEIPTRLIGYLGSECFNPLCAYPNEFTSFHDHIRGIFAHGTLDTIEWITQLYNPDPVCLLVAIDLNSVSAVKYYIDNHGLPQELIHVILDNICKLDSVEMYEMVDSYRTAHSIGSDIFSKMRIIIRHDAIGIFKHACVGCKSPAHMFTYFMAAIDAKSIQIANFVWSVGIDSYRSSFYLCMLDDRIRQQIIKSATVHRADLGNDSPNKAIIGLLINTGHFKTSDF